MEKGIHIALAPEVITTFLGIPVTNTLITSLIVTVLLSVVAIVVGKRLTLLPGRLQVGFEMLISFIFTYIEETLESKELARRYFPLIATMFLFIFTANILEFLPGIGSLGIIKEEGHSLIPLFRSVNTDLNVTIALGLIAFGTIELSGIFLIGFFKYAGKFLNFRSFMGFFIGIIELFSEMARLVSFSFRLFGNIFAGEVMITVVTFFVPVVLPVPFMLFEVFVGFIQAAIFSLLTLYFVKIAVVEEVH